MADIFISWGLPDSPRVQPLCRRLRGLGLTLFEYSHDMDAGDQIHDRVWRELQQARVAVICLSPYTAGRDWLKTETAWCFEGLTQRIPVVPVRLGALSQDQLPQLIREAQIFIFDLIESSTAEDDFLKLTESILAKLGKQMPYQIPAAIFAMTRLQCEELFGAWAEATRRESPVDIMLRSLCVTLGMASPPELFDLLKLRYGDRPEDLAPFKLGQPLLETIYGVLEEVNGQRAQRGLGPILLRWITDQLDQGDERRRAREVWRSGDSLVIIDSISSLHEQIGNEIERLPPPLEPSRAALLWVPPYTQLTAEIERPLEQAVTAIAHLEDALSDLGRQPHRPIAFDPGNSLAVRLWMLRTLAQLPVDKSPLAQNLRGMLSREIGIASFLATPQPRR